MKQDCPLCGATSGYFANEGTRPFFRCPRCDLLHVLAAAHLDVESEAARYNLHHNDSQDSGYRDFLDRLLIPLEKDLKPGAYGLDYGCGPNPTVSVLMSARGFSMVNYDPIYFKDETLLDSQYDFITCTETAEHFFKPAQDFDLLNRILRPGGTLGVMTSLYRDEQDFRTWQYARDPTHVSFYSRKTMEWIAARHQWTVEIESEKVILFKK